ncbi:MAG: DNA mismatch repair endonuclease MutL [Lachnospiraceae bacterium]|nr:DNA mismatch repair endonuclease MutL [Lachnospiraceae bacterium]
MGIINVLDFSIANLIAAGEVVDRPASAVKELTENAIDAGATQITVETKNGGSSLMRVTDNGCGMAKEDLPVCVKRHATSKIREAADLNGILTLGFRGEALAAIASVSKLRIITRRKEDEMGTVMAVDCGEVVSLEPTGAAVGTTVIVEELFANVPARRKFLKKDISETTAVVAVVEKIALSHPEIAVRLITDGVTRFASAGDGQLWNTVYAVLGRDFSKKLVQVEDLTGGVGVSGYIGRPDNVRGNRNCQNFFINGRYVKSTTASAALEQAFVSYCPPERFPVCVLNLTVHPAFVDVNVHPAKLEVKFSNEKAVFEAVYCAVRNALTNSVSRPEASLPGTFRLTSDDVHGVSAPITEKLESAEAARAASLENEKLTGTYRQITADLREAAPASDPRKTAGTDKTGVTLTHPEIEGSKSWQYRPEEPGVTLPPKKDSFDVGKPVSVPRTASYDGAMKVSYPPVPEGPSFAQEEGFLPPEAFDAVPEKAVPQEQKPSERVPTERAPTERVPTEQAPTEQAPTEQAPTEQKPPEREAAVSAPVESDLTEPLPWYRIAGVVFNCYVTVELADKMLLIDKHAAHERILFEEMKENLTRETVSQYLLIPIEIPLSAEDIGALSENADDVKKLGFDFDFAKEGNLARLYRIPASLTNVEASELFSTLASSFAEGKASGGITGESLTEKALFQASCKAAVKAGREDSPETIRWIVENVLVKKNVRFCPHGRPVAFEMTKAQVEHLFKRS